MLDQFNAFIKQEKLIGGKRPLLVAVSGGVDSITLAHLLHQAGHSFHIAHCNFGLRGEESDLDQEFVRDVAERHGAPFHVHRFQTSNHAKSKGISTQMAARELRYTWFRELIETHDLQKIAVGTHQSDAVETFFINLLRGSGLSGLRGIPVQNEGIIRPLMFATRQDIATYATSQNLSYREDSSNLSDEYVRNQLRHHIIPELKKIQPDADQKVLQSIQYLKGSERMVHQVVKDWRNAVLRNSETGISLSIEKLQTCNHPEDVLYELLQPYGYSGAVIPEIVKALSGQPGKKFLSKTHVLVKDRTALLITPISAIEENEPQAIDFNTEKISHPIPLEFSVVSVKDAKLDSHSRKGFLDLDKLQFPLKLRLWHAGDRFRPLGMKGFKKISDFLVDQKVPLTEKEKTFVLESNGEIAWLVGHRIDDRFKVGEPTKKLYIVEWITPDRNA